MKENKKLIKDALKKHLDREDKFENLVLNLALKKMAGAKKDEEGVYYSKKQKRVIMAVKTLEGTYDIPEGTEIIDDDAFWGCAFLEQVNIPETVTHIGNEAFSRCMSLKELVIPASVESLGNNPFVGLNSENIVCKSEHFVIENKLMFTADRKKLIACLTDAAMVIIPKGVVEIQDFAFSRRRRLKKVIIPDTVEVIGSDAFSDCDVLEKVTLPATVRIVEPHAFAECDRLKKLTFLGTVEHIARTSVSNCDALKKIIVPEGSSALYIKQLHIPLELEDIVIENTERKDQQKQAPQS